MVDASGIVCMSPLKEQAASLPKVDSNAITTLAVDGAPDTMHLADCSKLLSKVDGLHAQALHTVEVRLHSVIAAKTASLRAEPALKLMAKQREEQVSPAWECQRLPR